MQWRWQIHRWCSCWSWALSMSSPRVSARMTRACPHGALGFCMSLCREALARHS
ncbi:hypothetical protein BX661DRAFT_179988 [Kickxella alabastrina]|uniref:uncharacterized protein n=1 Tax=Kickxella alabastrina TaxID=61397 RepID=UPI0022210C0C|nr:uncharacterized protein BX661DRAFT_179988 [Kickxella alabastrina]KAI7832172.1 hypothetical protein BX661DRAFT_179988 [Kickxella alabastrina]